LVGDKTSKDISSNHIENKQVGKTKEVKRPIIRVEGGKKKKKGKYLKLH